MKDDIIIKNKSLWLILNHMIALSAGLTLAAIFVLIALIFKTLLQ